MPATPLDLAAHECLVYASAYGPTLRDWHFVINDQHCKVDVQHRMQINDAKALLFAALNGFGIAFIAEDFARGYLLAGCLIKVPPDYDTPSRPVQIIYHPDRRQTPKLKSLISAAVRDLSQRHLALATVGAALLWCHARALSRRGAMTADTADPTKAQPHGELTVRTIAMPADTNANGDIFGGWVMSQMDLAGGMAGADRAQGRVATVAVDAMTFIQPVRVGDVLSVYTRIGRVGRTSIRIQIEAWAHRFRTRHSDKVTEATFTFVAIDDHGRPRPVPPADTIPQSSMVASIAVGSLE